MRLVSSYKPPRPSGTPPLKRGGIYPALTVLLLFLSFNLFSQEYCYTKSSGSDFLKTIPKERYIETNADDTFVLRIFFHIVRKSDGTGGQNLSVIDTCLYNLKYAYDPHGICFDVVGIDEIWDDELYNKPEQLFLYTAGNGKFDDVSPFHYDAIDIYLLANDTRIKGGVAAGIPSSALAIGGWSSLGISFVSSMVLSHEVGHCLGLEHTFLGWCNKDGCHEKADGSNCETCGDFVCDTPADPTGCSESQPSPITCKWNGLPCKCDIGDDKDDLDKQYNPNTALIMSYSPPSCLQYHTPGQAVRMRAMIANSPHLQKVIVPNTLTLSETSTGTFDYTASKRIYSTQIIEGGSTTYRAGKEIILSPGFHATISSNFLAICEDGLDCEKDRNKLLYNSLEHLKGENENKTSQKKDISEQFNFRIFPNPNTGFFHIDADFSLAEITGIKVLNVLGVTVFETQNLGSDKIQLLNNGAGLYFVIITLKEGLILRQKMIIQK